MTTELGIGMFWLVIILMFLIIARRQSKAKAWIVYDFETGMLFKDGSFVKILPAGRYKFYTDNHEVLKVDTRPAQFSFQVSSITENKKIVDHNIIVSFRISKPEVFIKESSVPAANLALDKVRLSIRDIFAGYHTDLVHSKQKQIENEIASDANKELILKGIEITKIDLIILSPSS